MRRLLAFVIVVLLGAVIPSFAQYNPETQEHKKFTFLCQDSLTAGVAYSTKSKEWMQPNFKTNSYKITINQYFPKIKGLNPVAYLHFITIGNNIHYSSCSTPIDTTVNHLTCGEIDGYIISFDMRHNRFKIIYTPGFTGIGDSWGEQENANTPNISIGYCTPLT